MVVIYLLLIILDIYLTQRAVKKKTTKNWFIAIGVETVSLAVSIGLAVYFDNIEGKGSAPGLTYFTEVLAGMGTSVVTGIILFISLCLTCIHMIRKKRC